MHCKAPAQGLACSLAYGVCGSGCFLSCHYDLPIIWSIAWLLKRANQFLNENRNSGTVLILRLKIPT